MEKISFLYQLIKPLTLAGLILLISFSSGCAGNTIEYDPADSNLIGKTVHFNIPVGYVLLSKGDVGAFNREAVRIGRQIKLKREMDNQFSFIHKFPRENIKDGMVFTVVGSYWVRKGWIEKEFGTDTHLVVLKDENNILSVCWMPFFTDNTY